VQLAKQTEVESVKGDISALQEDVSGNVDKIGILQEDTKGRGINVKNPPIPMVGAKGDNVADDTQVFKNLLADSSITYIFIPKGTYKITDTLEINRPVTITGADKISTVLKLSTAGKSLFHIANTVKTEGVHLSNLNLVGMKSSDTGIRIGQFNNNVNPIYAVDCSFKNIRIYYFNTSINCEWSWCLLFENIRVLSCVDSLLLTNQANNIIFSKSNFSSCTNGLKIVNVQGVSFVECSFESLNEVLNTTYYAFITLVSPYIEAITTNSLGTLSSTSSLVIEGGYAGDNALDITISDNKSKLYADKTTIKIKPIMGWVCGVNKKNLNFLTGITPKTPSWSFGVPFTTVINNSSIKLKKSGDDTFFNINTTSSINVSNVFNLKANTYYMVRYKGRALTAGETTTQRCIQLMLLDTVDGSGNPVTYLQKQLYFDMDFTEKVYTFNNVYARNLTITFLANSPLDLKYITIVEMCDDFNIDESKVYTSTIPTVGTWKLADLLYNISPAAGGSIGWICTTAGTANNTAWVTSTTYTVGQQVNSGGKVYQVTTAGTSGTTAPTGAGTGITDGTVVWDYVGVLAVFKGYGAISS